MATVVPTKPTVEDFDSWQEDAGWCLPMEFLLGEVVAVPPIGEEQDETTFALRVRLLEWQRRSDAPGRLLGDVLVVEADERAAPDVMWWSASRAPSRDTGAVRVAPDLAVEVVGPRSRHNDLEVKPVVYDRQGVQEVWLVDLAQERVLVLRRDDGSLRQVAVLGPADKLTSPSLPGFSVGVADVLHPQS